MSPAPVPEQILSGRKLLSNSRFPAHAATPVFVHHKELGHGVIRVFARNFLIVVHHGKARQLAVHPQEKGPAVWFRPVAIEPIIIFHDGLYHSALWYYISAIGHFVLVAITSLIITLATCRLPISGVQWIIIRALIVIAIMLPIYFIVFRKNENAIAMIKTLKIAFTAKRKKSRQENK